MASRSGRTTVRSRRCGERSYSQSSKEESVRVLVTGATGHVGRVVVEQLVAAGVRVRAMTRSPQQAHFPEGVETVAGDLTDPAALAPVLAGVDRMYLFPVARTAREVVTLAGRAGVGRIIVLSSSAVTSGADTSFHLPVERAVEELGPEWTHVRPGEFMLNKLFLWGPSIRTEGVVYEPFPEAAWWPVHERDVADVAVAALLQDGHRGQGYDLSGPELITRREQVNAIATAIGREVRLEVVTPEQAHNTAGRAALRPPTPTSCSASATTKATNANRPRSGTRPSGRPSHDPRPNA
jgi:uncharacterized protein YbjT (DUF2867 family)